MINYLLFFVISALVLSFELSHVTGTKVTRIRGIPLSKNSLYDPKKDFSCLDGSRIITFDKVNDDYCDCGDGSDEPGTAACSNGFFFCENPGHKSRYIPSSLVNDGICDCCDASDEYLSSASCVDNCKELGREARAEAEKAAELVREGSKIRLQLAEEGRKLKNEIGEKLTKLKNDFLEAELIKKEKEIIKNQAVDRENAALEKYKPAESEATDRNDEQSDEAKLREADEYFKMLDSDESHSVTLSELQTRIIFDRDHNGAVTEEEAMYFLGQDEVNFDEFLEKSWNNIKPVLMKEQGLFRGPDDQEQRQVHEEHELEHEDEHDTEEDEDEEDQEQDVEGAAEDAEGHAEEIEREGEVEQPPEQPQVQYDEETQALIDEATAARTQYQQAEKAALDLQNEIRSLEAKIDRDYGPEEVFASLDGECYQYTDLEYVYTMCMFGRATQSAKSGGSEVSLGHWQDWAGPDYSKYSKAKFDRGLTCWNGPARSTMLDLRCGKENKLVSVSEPSRCEYAMIFTTPALCNPDADNSSVHDEL
ncbi:glucosidase 2 subunit beta [Microplitis mediator]|uniref:glucosidase 2 subunit beta n=1 Tax=Microplitis mediator TaxID=375433 RepID=UPI002555992F|nr:glucosidase 2 subunit beta [Microplitis mediator]